MRLKENLLKLSETIKSCMRFTLGNDGMKPLKGEWWMRLTDGKTGSLVEERHGHNIIVNSASILLARLLKDSREPAGGITYFAVGTGGSNWNLQNPPQATPTQTKLANAISRKAFLSNDITFVDPITGEPTSIPTNVLDFTITFGETEAVGPLTEMALFGGDATELADSGTQINYRTFPVLNKLPGMVYSITYRITA